LLETRRILFVVFSARERRVRTKRGARREGKGRGRGGERQGRREAGAGAEPLVRAFLEKVSDAGIDGEESGHFL